MVSRIVTLVVGVVLGALLMIAFHQPREGLVEGSNQNTETKVTANKSIGRDRAGRSEGRRLIRRG